MHKSLMVFIIQCLIQYFIFGIDDTVQDTSFGPSPYNPMGFIPRNGLEFHSQMSYEGRHDCSAHS